MRVTLLQNPHAGEGGPSKSELLAAFHDAGFEVRYRSTRAADVARAARTR
jgi:hypothetical protein